MQNSKTVWLGGLLVVLMGIVIWRWMSTSGFVTLNFQDASLSKVIKSIERQSGVRIATNANPTTPVTIRLKKAPVFEAIETLAVRLDGDVRLAYLAAPAARQINDVLAAFKSGVNPGGWTVLSYGGGGGGGFGGGFGGAAVTGGSSGDPRGMVWNVSDTPEKKLQALFDQGAQKTGAMFAVPTEWNPDLAKLPAGGKTGQVAGELTKTAKGKLEELFVLTVRPRGAGNEEAGGQQGGYQFENATVFSPQRRGGAPGAQGQDAGRRVNQEWLAERVDAQIALLPKEEQETARKDLEEARAFAATLRDLPADERRLKIEEQMNRPEVQAKMEERAAARDARSTPQQREQRFRRYIQRKEQAKGVPTKS